MKVIETDDKYFCSNCDQYVYGFHIKTKDGERQMTLCKDCLLELLDAIVRR